jgi:hypothetical protein
MVVGPIVSNFFNYQNVCFINNMLKQTNKKLLMIFLQTWFLIYKCRMSLSFIKKGKGEKELNIQDCLFIGIMDKLPPTGRNLGHVLNFRSGHLHSAHLWCYPVKLPSLKLKTWPKQRLGSLPLEIVLPVEVLLLE